MDLRGPAGGQEQTLAESYQLLVENMLTYPLGQFVPSKGEFLELKEITDYELAVAWQAIGAVAAARQPNEITGPLALRDPQVPERLRARR